ncbi:MAG: hypothetical protein U0105_24660 [Candidatus Obscuribacterales bacterium]
MTSVVAAYLCASTAAQSAAWANAAVPEYTAELRALPDASPSTESTSKKPPAAAPAADAK